ncbi:TetR/AcrR family transcriptional regulator [Bogoriella caseilytica]|uniref:TetR family transcriptional regulator n=1 Tax=Bogoriella caseilytica TaxID=56055 RepID=A0A3N2BDS2_9MICO|nr:TetR/AcrR family transcriptional regulator [Bogoriella caseilytica]ROR73385.1 TetR family transcriptional regulator [Bogoriella caseilytica]
MRDTTAVPAEPGTGRPDLGSAAIRPVSARRERTRERLLDAAFTVFSRHGVPGASIEAICEAAGFTRGAFYSNFSTKEELYLAVIERDVRRRLAHLEQAVADLGDDAVSGDRVNPHAVEAILQAVTPEGPDERAWHLVMMEFELLAMRDADVAAAYLAQKEQIGTELAGVLERVLGRLGMRFAIDQDEAVQVLEQVYLAEARHEMLSGTPSSAMPQLAQLILRPA